VELSPPPPKLKIGEPYAGAPALRRMLSTIGDLPPGDATAPTDPTFDANLSTGVRNYQARHGLGIDGLLGKATSARCRLPPRSGSGRSRSPSSAGAGSHPLRLLPSLSTFRSSGCFAFRTHPGSRRRHSADGRDRRTHLSANPDSGIEGDLRYSFCGPTGMYLSITQHEMLPKIRANPAYMAVQASGNRERPR